MFARYVPWLRARSRGRLPRWARGIADTSDLVQDALHHTLARLTSFEPRHNGAFRAYLRRAVDNLIRDEIRRAVRRPRMTELDDTVRHPGQDASQLQQLLNDETWSRYMVGLGRLSARDRRLVVGRGELGYTYKQLALVEGLSSPDAARMALRRALARLSDVMPDE